MAKKKKRSVGELILEGHLQKLLLNFPKVTYELEKRVNHVRYDIWLNTSPPIALEFDGIQHTKPNNFFFKTFSAFEDYKNNDYYKDQLNNVGHIFLLRFDGEVTYEEFETKLLGFKELLEAGTNDEQKTYKTKKPKENEAERARKKEANEKARIKRREEYLKYKRKKELERANQKKSKGTEQGTKGDKKTFGQLFSD